MSFIEFLLSIGNNSYFTVLAHHFTHPSFYAFLNHFKTYFNQNMSWPFENDVIFEFLKSGRSGRKSALEIVVEVAEKVSYPF